MNNLLDKSVRLLGTILAVLGAASVIASGIAVSRDPFSDFPAFDTVGQKLIAEYSYFTLWSAFIGTIVAASYAAGWGTHTNKRAAVARLDAAMMLIVTGLVYNLILADGTPKIGLYAFTNFINHELLPIAMPVLWILSMPLRTQRDIRLRTIGLALIIPAIWTAWTFYRGAVTGFYPYNFLDVTQLGYATAIRNTAGVYVLFFVLVAGLSIVERALNALGMKQTKLS